MANGEFGLYLIAESVRQERECKRLLTPTPMYTLDEVRQLAREYVGEAVNRTTDQLVLSRFLAWLAKREQGKESDNVR